MVVRTGFAWVLPELSIVLEALDRGRIRIPFVKVLDMRIDSPGCPSVHGVSCPPLSPSHASLIASSRPFQPSPAFAGEGRQGEQERGGTAGSGVAALLHLAEHVAEVEGGGLLA